MSKETPKYLDPSGGPVVLSEPKKNRFEKDYVWIEETFNDVEEGNIIRFNENTGPLEIHSIREITKDRIDIEFGTHRVTRSKSGKVLVRRLKDHDNSHDNQTTTE